MKMFPTEPLFIADKIIAYVCFILVIIDFMDLFLTVIYFNRKHSQSELDCIHKTMCNNLTFLKEEVSKVKLENDKKNIFQDPPPEIKKDKKLNLIRPKGMLTKEKSLEIDSSLCNLNSPSPKNQKKQKNGNDENENLEKENEYPPMIPKSWFTKDEAETLGYVESINYENAISKIEWNQPFIVFSIGNVKKSKYDLQNYLSIRLDTPLMRLRLMVYNVILVSCSTFPLLTSLLCFIIELLYIVFVIYSICRFRYQKNWLIIISRFNISIAIIAINLAACYISVTQDTTSGGVKEVSFPLQVAIVILVLLCIGLEFMMIVLMVIIALCQLVWHWIQISRKKVQKAKKKSILGYVWIIPQPEEEIIEEEEPVPPTATKIHVEDLGVQEMPDSSRRNGKNDVDRLHTRDAINKNEQGTVNGKPIRKLSKLRFTDNIKDYSPIYALVLGHLVDLDIKEENSKNMRIRKKMRTKNFN